MDNSLTESITLHLGYHVKNATRIHRLIGNPDNDLPEKDHDDEDEDDQGPGACLGPSASHSQHSGLTKKNACIGRARKIVDFFIIATYLFLGIVMN